MIDSIEIRPCGEVRGANLVIGQFTPDPHIGGRAFGEWFDHDQGDMLSDLSDEVDNISDSLDGALEDVEELRTQMSDAIGELTEIQMAAGDDEVLKLKIQEVIDGLR